MFWVRISFVMNTSIVHLILGHDYQSCPTFAVYAGPYTANVSVVIFLVFIRVTVPDVLQL